MSEPLIGCVQHDCEACKTRDAELAAANETIFILREAKAATIEDSLKAYAELAALKADAERLDWLEQNIWGERDDCYILVSEWRTPDGVRHGQGLRAAIDDAMQPTTLEEK